MEKNKKYFLDLSGLTHLWKKIVDTFANKADTELNFETIFGHITNIFTRVDKLDLNVLGITPKNADNYSLAVLLAESLNDGSIIKVRNSEIINDKMYIAGFYIVESNYPVSLKLIGTSSGVYGETVVEKLDARLSNLESNSIYSVSYSDNDNYEIEDNQLIIRYDDAFIANSKSLNALTHKAIAAKFGQLESMLTSIPKFTIKIVEELPTLEISTSTIYLVKSFNNDNTNLYTEYIYVEGKRGVWNWEKLGENSIALSNYVTRSEVEEMINLANAQYASKQYVDKTIENAKAEIVLSLGNEFITKDNLDNMVLESITTGIVGEGMAIPTEDVEKLKFL